MFIVDDAKGNQLLEIYYGDEDKLVSNICYRPLTSSFVIVKNPKGFMLLKNRFKNEWELPGGRIDKNESPRACAVRECFEESGYTISDLRFIGILKFFLRPMYHMPMERIEFTALYCTEADEIRVFKQNEEMTGLIWYKTGDSIENASRIDVKLLEFYRAA